ncbi:MAG: FecR domain-containing protein [Candidatus Marinarcus sp.]|uniref:FecR domain-containing protein n=1 Tax=Candidatus Marinarcus sp. TaxID=3100987 RepID=UPI003B00E8EE
MKKILLLLFILITFSFASIGQITALVGDVKISRDSNTILAKLGEELEKNDVINSSKGSKAQITMNDNTIITIGQNSTLNIFDYVYDANKPEESKASFGFMKGSFKSITGVVGKINKEKFKLRTKNSSIGIRGTTIIGNQQIIICTDGAISVTANNFTVNVDKQEFTRTLQGQAPTPPEPLKQETLDSVQKGLNAESSDSNTTESKESTETKENTTSSEEEKEGSKDDKDGTLTTSSNDDNKVTTPKENVTTPSEDTTPPTVLEDTPPLNPVKPDIPTEHISLSGFPLLGYASREYYQIGEMGAGHEDFLITIDNKEFSQPGRYDDGRYDPPIRDGNYVIWLARWGTWDSTFEGVPYSGYWIAGVKTDTSYISSLINNTSKTTKSFDGGPDAYIAGNILDNNNSYDIDSNSLMHFSFDFGAGINSFTGSLNLKYGEIDHKKNYNIEFKNGKINSSGFLSELTHGGKDINGSLHGSFFGRGGIEAMGGGFNFNDGSIQGAGVFIAK